MSSLKVAVRVRPFNSREIAMGSELIVRMEEKKTYIFKTPTKAIRESARDSLHEFTYDYSYWSFDRNHPQFVTQDQVYHDLGKDVINCAYEGYNACVFAYGQTGSGKTFTMMGSPDNPGLIPRICEELFERMRIGQESGTIYKTNASYLEIYNEKVKDLLGPHTADHALRVREHKDFGPYVEKLSQQVVSNFGQIQECITRGNAHRTTASTKMNDTSSRSHAIFTITFVQAVFTNNMPSETISKIHLVDLAGSERANSTGATGQRLREGAHINKSLVTLGSVISALAESVNESSASKHKKTIHVPYRDSVLTWLLKDSLGGNSKTIMIAAISPADCNYSETLSTLRYANRAKNIINKPTVNEDANVKLIRELREEINALKSMLASEVIPTRAPLKVLEDLQKKEAQEKVLTEEWTEKWEIAQSILQEVKSLGLRKSGVGVVLDSEMPHLIGIHNDASTGVTLYSLKEGETRIGSLNAKDAQDISLTGDDIRTEHCRILLEDGVATLYPCDNAQCWVNARLIDQPKQISQGDIILLGRTNIFRFNNPAEINHFRDDINYSQIDMSHLSLITSSRENLLSSSLHSEEDVLTDSKLPICSNIVKTQGFPQKTINDNNSAAESEHRQILEVIKNALRQLNIERTQMRDEHKTKMNTLTNELKALENENGSQLQYLDCQRRQLQARKDMLTWEKNNEKVQIDIACRQISTLQRQLDAKKEYHLKNDAEGCYNLDELSDEFLSKLTHTLDFAPENMRDKLKELCDLVQEITEKEAALSSSAEKVAEIDERMLELQDELEQLKKEREKALIAGSIYNQEQSEVITSTRSPIGDVENNSAYCETFSSKELEDQTPTHSAHSGISSLADDSINPAVKRFSMTDPLASTSCSMIESLTASASASAHAQMSDSGVSFASFSRNNQLHANNNCHLPPLYSGSFNNIHISDDESASCASCKYSRNVDFSLRYCPRHALRREISEQKALIMRNLELGVNKKLLDNQIDELQELQRRFFALEKEKLQGNKNNYKDTYEFPYDSKFEGNSNKSAYQRSSQQLANIEYSISVPNFLIRGAGKHTHFEYEVRVNLLDGKLCLLRRYSRFRQLHLDMKNCYGKKIAALTFPRRELFFGKSESVAKYRREILEIYLRDLLKICADIPQSPTYNGPGGLGLTCDTLAKLSPFFKKGLFENGKYGTG